MTLWLIGLFGTLVATYYNIKAIIIVLKEQGYSKYEIQEEIKTQLIFGIILSIIPILNIISMIGIAIRTLFILKTKDIHVDIFDKCINYILKKINI